MTKTDKQAVIYARFSDASQEAGYSIDAQLRSCRDYAEKNGIQVIEVFTDEGKSASQRLDQRDQFARMIDLALNKGSGINYIIADKHDRLFRDAVQAAVVSKQLKEAGVEIVSVKEPMIGQESPEAKLMEHLIIGINEFYSYNLGREIKKGLKERTLQGYLVFHPPYGYRKKVVDTVAAGHGRTGKSLSVPEVDESQAAVVGEIFTKYAQGIGLMQISRDLNAAGHRSATGKPWDSNKVAKVLDNPAYTGVLLYNQRQSGKYKGDKELITVDDFYPRIIDQATWEAVRKIRDRNSQRYAHSYQQRSNYLFSGLVKCARCGKT